MRNVWWGGVLTVVVAIWLMFCIGGLIGYQIGRESPARAILVGDLHQGGGSWSCVYQRERMKPSGTIDHPWFYDSSITK
jgi:hypothetical protein